MINFNCPHCKSLLSAEEEWNGAETQCPYCKKMLLISLSPAPMEVPATENPKKKIYINIKAILLCTAAVLLTIFTMYYFQNKSTFLLEDIVGVNIGKHASNKNPDSGNIMFDDYFHCFKVSPKYQGKIIFEKVSYPSSIARPYLGFGTAVVSSPAAVGDGKNNIRLISVIITDETLFADIVKDFSKKGFSNGKKGFYHSAVHISDLLKCDFKKNETYSFISENKQYMLHIETGELPGIISYKNNKPCAQIFLSGKFPENKGIRLLLDKNGFLGVSLLGIQRTALYSHSSIHYDGKSSSCTHVDGFR